MASALTWTHTGYAQSVHFGEGAVDDVPSIVRDVGGRRALLVTTAGRLASPAGQRLVSRLARSLAATFDGVRSHVPTTTVQSALGIARDRDVDCVVSFGGGSCADLGKAVCFFVEQEQGTPGASYVDRPSLPHVSIPTTYSGAELTPFFGMTDATSKRKTGAGGPTVAPIAAVYDPGLTLDLPVDVTAQTAMNALAHGVEAAYSPTRTPEAEAVAVACVRRIAAALPAVVDDPSSLGARTGLLMGAVLGGRCLHNASMGVHHGLSQLVGGRTGMPHGLANALILASALRFNAEAAPEVMRLLAIALGADDAAAGVDALRRRAGIEGGLSDHGMAEDDLDAVCRMAEGNGNVQANVRPVTEADARTILEDAW